MSVIAHAASAAASPSRMQAPASAASPGFAGHAAGAMLNRSVLASYARRQLTARDPARQRGAGPTPLESALTMTVPGTVATIMRDGYAAAPADAPAEVQEAIWAGNQLIGLPYLYGGGHGSFLSGGYDCSGSVSWALHGGGLLATPLDSSELLEWDDPGRGAWVTVYTQEGHAFLEIAGIRLDTSSAGDPDGLSGPRWRPLLTATAGYVPRHPAGY